MAGFTVPWIHSGALRCRQTASSDVEYVLSYPYRRHPGISRKVRGFVFWRRKSLNQYLRINLHPEYVQTRSTIIRECNVE